MKKIVKKHWSHELWIDASKEQPCALKKILSKAGNRTSLQVHKHKFETMSGKLYKSKTTLNVDYFLEYGMLL